MNVQFLRTSVTRFVAWQLNVECSSPRDSFRTRSREEVNLLPWTTIASDMTLLTRSLRPFYWGHTPRTRSRLLGRRGFAAVADAIRYRPSQLVIHLSHGRAPAPTMLLSSVAAMLARKQVQQLPDP